MTRTPGGRLGGQLAGADWPVSRRRRLRARARGQSTANTQPIPARPEAGEGAVTFRAFQARAETLAESAENLGHDCAALVAGAWAARILPGAVAGIVGAAMALGADRRELFQHADPIPEDRDMLAAAEELAGGAWETLRAADDLEQEAQATLEAARQAQLDAARREGDGDTARARDDAAAAVRAAADCECALEAVAALAPGLRFALRRLEQVPDDLHVAYEIPYDHVAAGKALPYSGDFITGAEGAA